MLDKESGLGSNGDSAGSASGSSRTDGGRVGVGGACVCELKSTQT